VVYRKSAKHQAKKEKAKDTHCGSFWGQNLRKEGACGRSVSEGTTSPARKTEGDWNGLRNKRKRETHKAFNRRALKDQERNSTTLF